MSDTQFDDLTDVYEAMIDWPKRLGAEAGFFRPLFERLKVQRVADVACGTGQHAAMFHSWGLEVHASDISENMIARARQTFGQREGLHWRVQSFEQPPGPANSFDAVVCIGNSLALAPDLASAEHALRQMLGATRPGGVVVVHILNIWKLPPGPCVWQKCIRKMLANGPSLIIKGVHRSEQNAFAELLVIGDQPGNPPVRSHSIRFLGLHAEQLTATARAADAADVALFGGHQHQPYNPADSADLIVVAMKTPKNQ
jgi:SAM-dependent methyltransferase